MENSINFKFFYFDGFPKVYAYDYSEGFVENMMSKAREMKVVNLEGRQGDSHRQQEMYPGQRFDLIFGCNLIDRLHTPADWVTQSKVRYLYMYMYQCIMYLYHVSMYHV